VLHLREGAEKVHRNMKEVKHILPGEHSNSAPVST
jgi:hypothetical protein